MTINFNKSELSKIMAFLSPYIVSKMPVSMRVVKGGSIEFFATAGVADGGSALVRVACNKSLSVMSWKQVDGLTLQGVITNADEGVIAFNFGDTALTIKCAPRTTNELIYMNVHGWSDLPFVEPVSTINGKHLNMIAMMTETASTDEARPGLNGIFISAGKKKIEAAASDGFCLSFATIKAGEEIEAPGALYSVKALNRAKRALKATDAEELKIGFGLELSKASENKSFVPGFVLSITREDVQAMFHVPQMSGSFPDYKAITKSAPKGISVEIETSAMNSLLKRASAIEGSVFFQVVNGFLWFMAANESTQQKCVDSLAVDIQGESAVMHYAPSLLKDTLKACAANGKIKLTFPAVSNAPMLFEGHAAVIAMPLANTLKESPFKNLQPALI